VQNCATNVSPVYAARRAQRLERVRYRVWSVVAASLMGALGCCA